MFELLFRSHSICQSIISCFVITLLISQRYNTVLKSSTVRWKKNAEPINNLSQVDCWTEQTTEKSKPTAFVVVVSCHGAPSPIRFLREHSIRHSGEFHLAPVSTVPRKITTRKKSKTLTLILFLPIMLCIVPMLDMLEMICFRIRHNCTWPFPFGAPLNRAPCFTMSLWWQFWISDFALSIFFVIIHNTSDFFSWENSILPNSLDGTIRSLDKQQIPTTKRTLTKTCSRDH